MAKRSEISGAILYNGADLAHQLHHIDAVLLILGYKGDPSQIVPLRRKPNRFRKGELYRLILKCEAEGSKANKETAQRIVKMKGWEPSLVERIRQCVNTAKVRRRRKAKDSGERQGREEIG
ncbi:hypothetical protein NKH36_20935 [Mesorhizobium sp. M1312]|uniref:hypothetical protein n=1 Tax=unclassified Mesorhizobium TaxID=325217 RepID=UPI00333B35FE